MSRYQIAVIIGSIRKDSFNRRMADALARLAPPEFHFIQPRIDDLPLYNQDDDDNQSATVKRLKNEIHSSQGLIFVTPEYNRSIPGVLKNAIDHASRPYGHGVWGRKPAGIMGVSAGMTGTAPAQQHLRNILACLDVYTMGQPEMFIQMKETLFDQEGSVGKESREFLRKWMDRYVAWVKKHAA
ncbi:MAG TPA: NAD(P)H-dependent oxidoreductase [Acidobacteriota bacterium]|nr:NAD(P)H-dependent oxidoreductase [Acidobacteriota bacterium]